MTKVVINRCFGGFGLSRPAFELLLQRKGVEYDTAPSGYSIRGMDDVNYYTKGHAGEEEHFISEYQYFDDRSDPDLVGVVELLGKDSWGWAAELMVLEIPDDVKWHVEEYDGWEHIAEDHRVWP